MKYSIKDNIVTISKVTSQKQADSIMDNLPNTKWVGDWGFEKSNKSMWIQIVLFNSSIDDVMIGLREMDVAT
jgi:hypothetical protein